MNKEWKFAIVILFTTLIGYVMLCSKKNKELFDINLSKWQQADVPFTKNSEIVDKKDIDLKLDHNNATNYRTAEDINYELDNTFGDVLVEWDFDDTGDLLDNGSLEGVATHTLKCSRSCCPSQWPLPRELRDKGNVCGRDLVRSNYTCGNGSESGCVCLPRKNRDMIARRGNNATWNRFD